MKILGFQKMTLLDYPGKVACTIFTGGCNFRCPFCHNALLVTQMQDAQEYTAEEILTFLRKRQGVLDGVCITGGEPLMNKDIFEFFPNHIRVTVPFRESDFNVNYLSNIAVKELNKLQISILKLIMDKPNITQEELAMLLDVNKRTIIRNFKVLLDEKYIERVGANKNGYWKVMKID